jgi:hypothetical protein
MTDPKPVVEITAIARNIMNSRRLKNMLDRKARTEISLGPKKRLKLSKLDKLA